MNDIPTYLKRLTLFCGLLLTFWGNIHAQKNDTEDTFKPVLLYFRFDKALIDSGYMDNGHTLRHLDKLLSDSILTARIDSIIIISYASPEGIPSHNKRLAKLRSHAVKSYLTWRYPHLNKCSILPRPQGENWQELRRLIVEDINIPRQKEVLHIIDSTPESEKCKILLKSWIVVFLIATYAANCCAICAMLLSVQSGCIQTACLLYLPPFALKRNIGKDLTQCCFPQQKLQNSLPSRAS